MVVFLVFYYVIINLIAFVLYGIDKHRAKKGRWRISESVLILFAVLGGALGAFLGMKAFRHKTLKRKFKVTVPIFLVVHLLIVGFFAYTTIEIITFGNRHDEQAADVAIVLGAATTGREIKPVFQERVNEAIRLYEAGKCEKIILTGGVPAGSDVADSQLAFTYAVEQGVPEEAILIETQSSITEENLIYAKALMRQNGYDSALIVSDPLHMKRAYLMAQDLQMGTIYSVPTRTSMYRSFGTNLKLLNHEEAYYVGYLILRLFWQAESGQ